MKWKILRLVIILSVLFFRAHPAKAQEIRIVFQNYRIIYSPADEGRAMTVLNILKEAVPRMEHFYGRKLRKPVSVFLPASTRNFNQLTGGRLPAWSGAVYISKKNAVVIKKPEWVSGRFKLRKELLHEISHVYFDAFFRGKRVPLWLNEGLAEYLSGERVGIQEGVVLANALWAKKIIPLSHIDSLMTFSTARARLAYLESYTAVLFLQNHYFTREAEWQVFFRQVAAEGMEKAIRRQTGMDFIDFELSWYRWLQKKYRWFVIFNLENFIWLALILVLIGALYALRYRNRKILSRWEREELFEDPWREPNLHLNDENEIQDE